MSNNDITKWPYILEMNVVDFLNTLSYYKDKQDFIEQQTKDALRKR